MILNRIQESGLTATDRLLPRLEGVRRLGDGWVARCPAHQDRTPSLAVRRVDDRVLLHCHAGCTVDDICAALEVSINSLFDNAVRSGSLNAAARLRERAARGLERWRSERLTEACELLRNLDQLAADAVRMLRMDDTNETAWAALATAYHRIVTLEWDFDRLNSKNTTDQLACWRERQGAERVG